MYWYLAGTAAALVMVWYCIRKYPAKSVKRQASGCFLVGMVLALFMAAVDEKASTEQALKRKAAGEGEYLQQYKVDAQGILEGYDMSVEVSEEKLSQREKQEIFEKAKEELEERILGENVSLQEITGDLYLPQTLQESAVEVEYSFSDYEVFAPDGTMQKQISEPTLVEIQAELFCQGESCLYCFYIQAVPEEKSTQQQFADAVYAALQEENKREDTKEFRLPGEVAGVELSWKKEKENRSIIMVFLGAAAGICILFSEREKQKKQDREEKERLLLDYPEIASKLVLLLGAGMNTALAWEKIAAAYERGCAEYSQKNMRKAEKYQSRHPAYEYMVLALSEMRDGVGEAQVYERFGERCRLPQYRKLSALLVQNIRQGNREICRMLEECAREAFEIRKETAKKAGEAAATKLLFPMILMLLVVLVILIFPAVLTMQL